jgi:hypothetical protein
MRARHRLFAVVLPALLAPGCMFHIEHRLPVDATFGQARTAEAVRTPFESTRTKRYLLGGTLPWSLSYRGSRKLVDWAPGRRVEGLEIRTRFTPIDALLRFVPYLSYVLAQRTVEMRGVYVDAPSAEGVETTQDSATGDGAAPGMPHPEAPEGDELALGVALDSAGSGPD